MTSYQPIDCGDYDFLEIACMDNYVVEVETTQGKRTGTAKTIVTGPEGEHLCLQHSDGVMEKVRIDRILRLRVLSHPSRFDVHEFASPS